MARTKPLEEDEPLKFARGVMDTLIAKHDPESVTEQGKDANKVASGLKGGSKGGHQRAQNHTTFRHYRLSVSFDNRPSD